MDLERHVWSLVMNIVEKAREIDKKNIKNNGHVPPSVISFSYCPKCDRPTVCKVSIISNMELIRGLFPIFIAGAISETEKCRKCGGSTLPIGYAYSSEAWNLDVEGMDKKEIDLYRNAFGTIAAHPKKREVYLTAVVTVIGKKMLMDEIIREDGKVRFRKVKLPKKGDLSGRFILPLPRINLNEAIKNL